MRHSINMEETKLIEKLKELQSIKPRKEWVILAKSQILEPKFAAEKVETKQAEKVGLFGILSTLPSLIWQRKLAYAFAAFLFVFFGTFGFAQYTVPGDSLFLVKKMTEQSQIAFKQDQLKYAFETANKRLNDLTQVVKENRTQNIEPAMKEFQASISQAAKDLVASITNKDEQSIKDIAMEVKKIEDTKKELKTLGVNLEATEETKELSDAIAPLVQREIEDLEKTKLTEEKELKVEEIKELYAAGEYYSALEKILTINN